MPIYRKHQIIVTNPDGSKTVIEGAEAIKRWLDTLSEEERETYKARYRFEPVRNNTGIPGYTGTDRGVG